MKRNKFVKQYRTNNLSENDLFFEWISYDYYKRSWSESETDFDGIEWKVQTLKEQL